MILNITYCKFTSYEPFSDFTGIDDDSFVIYLTKDDDSNVYITSFNFGISRIQFSIPDDSNQYAIQIDSTNGVNFNCVDSSGSPVNFPYNLNVSTELFLSYFSKVVDEIDFGAKFTSVLDGIDNLNNSLNESLDSRFSSVFENISSLSDDFSNNFEDLYSNNSNNLTSCFGRIDSLNEYLDSKFSSVSGLFDTFDTYLDSHFSSISGRFDSLATDISTNIKIPTPDVYAFASLNGASGSYKDGQSVTVDGLDGIFTVESSQMLRNDANVYLIIYKVSRDGNYGLFPSTMVHLSTGA